MDHFSHHHVLAVYTSEKETCGMCNDSLYYEICYGCDECQYFIHERCAVLPQLMDHFLHDPLHQPLTLIERSPDDTASKCYYCDESFQYNTERFAYICEQCDLHMHMRCAQIPPPTAAYDGNRENGVVQYICHEHPMTFVEHDESKRGAKCILCHSPWAGSPTYSCTSSTKCKNFLHNSCVESPRKIQHPFHSHHSLMIQFSNNPRCCRSCCKEDCRSIFSCQDGCDFSLCIECASQLEDITVKCKSHDHPLFLIEKANAFLDIQCDACQKRYQNLVSRGIVIDEVDHTLPIMFRCMECEYNLHFLCGPLPFMIAYDYHIHPLILTDYLVNEEDYDEYYCDVCEKERDPEFRIYYCEDCKFVAHIHCLKDEIMKLIRGNRDTSDGVELWALGEYRWKLGMANANQENETINQTLRDIMDSLTEEEKEKIIQPVPREIIIRDRNLGDNVRKLNSRFDLAGSIDDFDRLKQFFQIRENEYYNLLPEIGWYAPDEEGLKVDDKYLRQKVVEVDGNYMVPKTLAPILKTMLQKYGDLGGYSSLTRGMKSVAATLLSIIIDKMCKTKVEDVRKEDLQEWTYYLRSTGQIAGFDLYRYYETLDAIFRAYLGFKAIRCINDVRERLDMWIATFERCKKNREELDTLEPSSMMEEFLSEASKWKRKTIGDMLV